MSAAACAAKKLLCGTIANNLKKANKKAYKESQESDLSDTVKAAISEASINADKAFFLEMELIKAGEVVG